MRSAALLLVSLLALPALPAFPQSTTFDPNPAHPWNELYAALHQDRAPSQQKPIPAPYLPTDEHSALLAELDSFIAGHREKAIKSPLKRAILQQTLWATFDQVSDPTALEQDRRREIARRCALIIGRIALSDAEIASLPDNFAIAVRNGEFPPEYDNESRKRAFLPPDLLTEPGPWVMLAGSDALRPAAIRHVEAAQGRAIFYVLIRLPGERNETVAYLRELANFPQPYRWNQMYATYPYARSPVEPNPDLPQFPAGTQVALVRRMVLTNSTGELVVTPVIESVQLRVYRKDPRQTNWDDSDRMDTYELSLAPEGLFEGSSGLSAPERSATEHSLRFETMSMFRMGGCHNCHGSLGVLSLQTYTRGFGGRQQLSPWFETSKSPSQERLTFWWKKRDYTWGLLSAFLAPATGH